MSTTIVPTPPKSAWSGKLGRLAVVAAQLIIVIAAATLLVIGLRTLSLVVIPTILALILASSFWPLVRWLRCYMNPLASAWIVLLGSITILGGIGFALTMTIRGQWNELASQAQQGVDQLVQLTAKLPPEMASQAKIEEFLAWGRQFLTSSEFSGVAMSSLSTVGTLVTGGILVVVFLFFFLKDGDSIWNFFMSWLPERYREKVGHSGIQTVLTLGDYVRGTSIIAAVDAIVIGIGLMILQLPLALPLTVIIFLGGFIPMVGATLAGALAALVALVAQGPVSMLIVIAIVVGVNQLEGNFLQPIVMSKALNMHALVILISLTAGTIVGGLVGAVLAVPMAAAAWAVVKIWSGRQSVEDEVRLQHVERLEKHSQNRTERRAKA